MHVRSWAEFVEMGKSAGGCLPSLAVGGHPRRQSVDTPTCSAIVEHLVVMGLPAAQFRSGLR